VAANNNANDATLRLISEFAAVEVGRDDRGNGPRLMIRTRRAGIASFSIRSSLPRWPRPGTRTCCRFSIPRASSAAAPRRKMYMNKMIEIDP